MLKIAFVTIGYPPLSGGLPVHVHGIVKLAEELGYQPIIITPELNPSIQTESNPVDNVFRLHVNNWFHDSPIFNPYRLYQQLKTINADIIHVVYPFPIGLETASLFAHLNKKKLICTYVDDIIVKFPFSLLIKVYEDTVWKFCKRWIQSISISTLEYGQNAIGLADWTGSVYEIPPPVFDYEYSLSLEKKFEAKKRLNLRSYDKVVLFVGSLRQRTTYKRLDLLLRAWSEVKKQNPPPNVVLLILGDGELIGYYKSMAKSLGLTGDDVIFKGFVPRETLIECYLAGDVLVLPSEDNNEAFGIVVVEAMIYGNVVVGTNIPGIRGAINIGTGCHVSLVAPKQWGSLVDELKSWLNKDLNIYAIENHRHIKTYYSRNTVKEQLVGLYANQ